MDTLTQIALGAAVGQAAGYKRLGRSALALGALGGVIPDLDVFAAAALGPFAEWRFHRGITHSLIFGPLMGPVLGYALWRTFRRWRPMSRCADIDGRDPMIAVMVLALITHPLLDLFTTYGTQLLAPFSDARFSLPAIPIIDPSYTIILLAAVAFGIVGRKRWLAPAAAGIALTLSSAYLFYAWSQNDRAEAEARRQLASGGVQGADVRAYTTMFQPWLRRVVVREQNGLRVGFISTWAPTQITWTCFRSPQHPALDQVMTTSAAQVLAWFADGQVWPSLREDGQGRTIVRLTDLRYGFPGPTLAGWWGVEVTLDQNGAATDAVRIRIPSGASRDAFAALYRAGAGDVASLYQLAGSAEGPPHVSTCEMNALGPMQPGPSG
ncbi:metal-dependent hydrolase [Microvirga arabica]|uniref:Metal-dependent hydrolase n=1 Tax=Microvirga arabica TaxID=1128671 RepID=A0ABV6Y717_9HYPH